MLESLAGVTMLDAVLAGGCIRVGGKSSCKLVAVAASGTVKLELFEFDLALLLALPVLLTVLLLLVNPLLLLLLLSLLLTLLFPALVLLLPESSAAVARKMFEIRQCCE